MARFDKTFLIIIIGLSLIVISNTIGHFVPPFSIMVTPIVMLGIIGGVNSSLFKINFYLTVLYSFALLLLNDWLVRQFAGGTHDDAGRAWIMLLFVIAFVLSIVAMLFFAFGVKNNDKGKRRGYSLILNLFLTISATGTGIIYSKFLSDM